jgi:hypothetical protein
VRAALFGYAGQEVDASKGFQCSNETSGQQVAQSDFFCPDAARLVQ